MSFGSFEIAVEAVLSVVSARTGQSLVLTVVENSQNHRHWEAWRNWANTRLSSSRDGSPSERARASFVGDAGSVTCRFVWARENGGYCRGNNLAMSDLASDFHLVLNPDCRLLPGGLETLVGAMRPGVGVVSGVLLATPAEAADVTSSPTMVDTLGGEISMLSGRPRLPHAGVRVTSELAPPRRRPLNFLSYAGACALFRSTALRSIGGFPDQYFLYFDEAHVTYALGREGWALELVPTPVAMHARYSSTRLKDRQRKSELEAFHATRSALLFARHLGKRYVVAWSIARIVGALTQLRHPRVAASTLRGLMAGLNAQ